MPDHASPPPDQSREHLRMFREAATLLASSLELDDTLANAIGACLPALGDFGYFDVVLEGGVRRTVRAHQDAATEVLLKPTEWVRSERTDIHLCALSSGSPVLHTDIDDAWYRNAAANDAHLELLRKLAFRSMLSVPLRYGGELLGALTLFMGRSGRMHTHQDLEFAEQIGALAAPIVYNATLLDRQRRSESELRASEARLRLATDAGRIGIWELDVGSGRVAWSDRVYELHGLTRAAYDGTVGSFMRVVYPDDRAALSLLVDQAVALRSSFTAEYRTILPSGEVRWFSTSASVSVDAGGVRLFGATTDITAQKERQLALQSQNDQLQTRAKTSESERDRLWRLSQDVFAVASFDGYLRAVNPAFTRVLGWSESEALGMPFLDLVDPEQHHKVHSALASARSGRAVHQAHLRCRHKGGGYRWLSWTAAPEGELMYACGHDVTELRGLREEQLLASEARLQMALEVGGMGAWQWNLVTGAVRWWPGMDTLHGLPRGASLGTMDDYMELVHPDDRERVSAELSAALAGRLRHRLEYRVRWPDGTVRWLESRADFSFDADGAPAQLAGMCVDVTRRMRREQDLRFVAEVSDELASMVDHRVSLAAVARLAVGHFACWSAVDLLGPDSELEAVALEHANPAALERLAPAWRQRALCGEAGGAGWQVLRTGQPCWFEQVGDDAMRQIAPGAEARTALRQLGLRSFIAVPLLARGTPLGVLTFATADQRNFRADDLQLAEDIGRRVGIALDNAILYGSLKQADRRKDEFLAMLAHELRNPLAPIRAAAELLKLSHDPAIIGRTSGVIARQVDHMTGLVDDLLDVSRVTRGLVKLDKRPVRLDAVANQAVEQVRALIESKSQRLSLRYPDEPLLVDGDENRLTQVLANLLNNAAKYTPAGGAIELELAASADYVTARVRDNGIGMEPALVATAFELFAQAERSADRSQGGLGIGLALVKSLVELHGGRVKASSDGPGQGSEFTIRLPRLEALADDNIAGTQGEAAPKPSRALQILVVDDNADAADVLGLLLKATGHHVAVAHRSVDALEWLGRQAFDACILDIGLPEIDGYQLARAIRAMGGNTPRLVALTGYGQDHDRQRARAAGFDHYLVKPVNMDSLLEALV